MIFKQNIWYERAQDHRTLHIYVPDDYFNTDQRYPVTYFFDGHNLFRDEDATYGTCWGLKKFLDQWNKKMIIVGMECSHNGDERLSEYLPYPIQNGMLAGKDGYGKETFDWIVNTVKPYVDTHYRTMPFRECTAIAGSSMGGLMAVYGAICYNNYFSKAACLSSAIYWCMDSIERDIQTSSISMDTRMYLSWGTKEVRGIRKPSQIDTSSYAYRANKKVQGLMRQKGANVQMYCQVKGRHCEEDWEKQIPIFMDFLWQDGIAQNVE